MRHRMVNFTTGLGNSDPVKLDNIGIVIGLTFKDYTVSGIMLLIFVLTLINYD